MKALNFLGMRSVLLIPLLILSSQTARATEVIEFPEEELATESVLPKFDQPTATKKRTVPTAHRFEAGVNGGTSLADAFFNIYPVGVNAAYHFTEVSAVEIRGDFFFNSATSYKDQIKSDTGLLAQTRLDKNPASKYDLMVGYEFTPYYGKISLTKSKVINLSIVAALDAGVISFEDGTVPAVSFDLGQKFYFSPNWGIRADLRTIVYNGTDVIYDPPDKRLFTNVMVTIGFLYFFPSATH